MYRAVTFQQCCYSICTMQAFNQRAYPIGLHPQIDCNKATDTLVIHIPSPLQVTRHVMDAASGRSLPVKEVLEIPVKPGWKEGTRITFAGKGDETAPGTAADLVFVVKQQPHARFERRGNDLHTRVKLPLVTALTGGSASVVMPDGRSLALHISAPPVQPGATRLVVGEGMPVSKGGKGDLHITFDVVFPTQLTSQQKAQLRHILPEA